MRQVYEELKIESWKGDFYSLVKKDLEDLNIPFDESMIIKYSKTQWKKHIRNAVKYSAFRQLVLENSVLANTKEIIFEELKTSEYLLDNRNTSISRIILSLRSKTFDIKNW